MKNSNSNHYEQIDSNCASVIKDSEIGILTGETDSKEHFDSLGSLVTPSAANNLLKNKKPFNVFFSLMNEVKYEKQIGLSSGKNQKELSNKKLTRSTGSNKKNFVQEITFRQVSDFEADVKNLYRSDEEKARKISSKVLTKMDLPQLPSTNLIESSHKEASTETEINQINEGCLEDDKKNNEEIFKREHDRIRQRNRTIRQTMIKKGKATSTAKSSALTPADIASIIKESEKSTNFGKSRFYLKYIDSIIALAVLVNIVLSIIDNEIYTSYSDSFLKNYTNHHNITVINMTVLESISNRTISAEENTLRYINALIVILTLILIYFHYFYKIRVLQAEDKLSKYDNLYSSGLYKYMILEMIICGIFYPPHLNLIYSGSTSDVIYANNMNSIISFVVMFKSYIIIRVYSYFSRWTNDLARNICIKENVKAGIKFAIKAELKKRPYLVLSIFMVVALSLCAFAMRNFEFGVKDPTGATISLKGDNDLQNLMNCFWLIIVTMTTVGYGDMFPRSILGRLVGVVACIIGMIIVSMIIVSLAVITQFTNDEEKAYMKLKKLRAEENVSEKATEVIKAVIMIRKFNLKKVNQKKIESLSKANVKYALLTQHFVHITQLKRTISNFKNDFKIAISHSEPVDDILNRLEQELEGNIKNISKNKIDLNKADENLRKVIDIQEEISIKNSLIIKRQQRISTYLLYMNNLNYQKKIDGWRS